MCIRDSLYPNRASLFTAELPDQKSQQDKRRNQEDAVLLPEPVSYTHLYVDMKGWHVQFNTVSTDVLRDAILHPENYKDLIVRVAGYSALFVALDPVLQRDIIERMEHEF